MIGEFLKNIKSKKYMLIILMLGILIMLIPDMNDKSDNEKRITEEKMNTIEVTKLEKMLKKINGVKSCDVLVTYENQGETNFAYDVREGTNTELEIKLSDKDPLIKSISNPEIRGIFVLVKGSTIEKNEVVHIIKGATGVPLHRIYVKVSEGD